MFNPLSVTKVNNIPPDQATGNVQLPASSGTTAQRPDQGGTVALALGYAYFDTTIALPVRYAGAGVWKTIAGIPA